MNIVHFPKIDITLQNMNYHRKLVGVSYQTLSFVVFKDNKIVAYVGIELESIKNETFCDCRGYNCGISKFKGLPAEDIQRNFEDQLQRIDGGSKNLRISLPGSTK